MRQPNITTTILATILSAMVVCLVILRYGPTTREDCGRFTNPGEGVNVWYVGPDDKPCAVKATLIDGTLTISGKGPMNDYRDSPWWYEEVIESVDIRIHSLRDHITNVIIEKGVTSIGHGAFSRCRNLTSITIPNSVTTIENDAFLLCNNLTSVSIPSSVTSIEKLAFGACGGLTSFIVAANNIRYSDVNGVLFNKTKDTLILYPQGKYGVYTIPSNVTGIKDRAFAFSGLTSVVIPNNVTSIVDEMFHGCENIASVAIPSSVTSIGMAAFASCVNLTSVTIPVNVKYIGNGAFFNCERLKTITYLNPNPPIIDDSVFDNIHKEACLYVPDGSIDIYRSAEWWKDFECIKPLSAAPQD